MRKIYTILLLLTISIYPAAILAQESLEKEQSTTTKYFEIKMVKEGQSAWNKAVTYSIYVTPKIDSAKTEILWNAPSSVEIKPKHEQFVDMYRGQSYNFKASVKPTKSGSFEVTVNLIAWQHDTNYTNSVSDIVTFNEDLLSTPVESSYTLSLIAKYLILGVIGALTVWGAIVFGKRGLNSLKVWLTPPN